MSDQFQIKGHETASAVIAGFASEAYAQNYKQGWSSPFPVSPATMLNKLKEGVDSAWELLQKGWKFWKGWFDDDPVNAVVGAGAGILAVGVIIVVGGQVIGALGGAVTALRSMSLLSKARLLLGTALTAGIIGPIIRHVVRGVQFLWNFNWNITDKELNARQDALLTSLYGRAGTVAGTALASLVCGLAPVEFIKSFKTVKLNPAMLAKIKEVSEFDPQNDNYGELYEELMESVKVLIDGSVRVASQMAFIEAYKNIRKWIKRAAKFPIFKDVFPGLAGIIEKWGNEGSQAWSFASATEEFIEGIDDTRVQAFAEEALESFMDTCTESAMIISYTL